MGVDCHLKNEAQEDIQVIDDAKADRNQGDQGERESLG